jgi:hypothetical protein
MLKHFTEKNLRRPAEEGDRDSVRKLLNINDMKL